MRRHPGLVFVGLLIVFAAGLIASLSLGAADIPPGRAAAGALSRLPGLGPLDPGLSDSERVIIFELRLPRLVLALLVGSALAVAGVVMQAFFQNPMAAPSIIGVSSGAALGATLAIMLGLEFQVLGLSAIPVVAFVGALGVTALVYVLSRRGGRTPVGVLLLTGIAVGAMASALSSLLMVTGQDPQHLDLDRVVYWMLGSVAGRGWPHVRMILPYVVVAGGAIYLFGRDLNVLLLGDETAHYLGLDVERVKLLLLVFSSLLAAAAVAVSGVVGFVGLIVPHLMRIVTGPEHRVLLPASAVAGGVLLALADLVARTAAAPTEIPVGIITSLLGAPFFLYLLHRRREYGL
jgi:iron complex transport system permease protein